MLGNPSAFERVHHVGVTVTDLDRAIAFWQQLLGEPGRDRMLLEGPRLGELLGYPRARVDSYWFDLPGGVALELLQYLEPMEPSNDPSSARPGNVHICLQVEDIYAAHLRALAAGATRVSPEPIEIMRGPRAGSRIVGVRTLDGVTIELFSPRAAT